MNIENLRHDNIMINPNLQIKTASSPTVKSNNAFAYKIANKIYTKAAGDMPALTGTIADVSSAIYKFVINAAWTISVEKSDDVLNTSNLDTVNFAVDNEQGFGHDDWEAVVGYVMIVNTSWGAFTWGTTALDAAWIAAYYIQWTEVLGR